MKKLFVLAAAGEAAMGLVLVVYPPVVVQLLFNAPVEDAGIVMCRIAGIALIALGAACWPGSAGATANALWGMLTYSALATLYLVSLGVKGERVGSLLWPAVAVHVILTVLLVRTWSKVQRTPTD